MNKILASLLLVLSTTGAANADMSVNLLGGLNYSKDKYDPASTTTNSAQGGLSYGATFEFSMAPMIGLELGAISTTRKTKFDTGATGYSVYESKGFVFPLMVRFTALPIVDFGIGGYYAPISDTVNVTETTIVGATTGERATTSAASSDYGLRASVRAKFPLAPLFRFLIDLNYTMGLKDTDTTSTQSQKTSAIAALAGVSIGF